MTIRSCKLPVCSLTNRNLVFMPPGNEGIPGISLFTDGKTTLSRAVVQHAGCARRMGYLGLMGDVARRADTLQPDIARGDLDHVLGASGC